ncbi:PepSY domain-containing protein [Sphingomonas sp. WKB10]|nr:PepSY domain-containing protein [Sphingomonas sp. WKB10]
MNAVKWRKTWFQVHKWIGLTLAILIIPLSLSGAALVWREPLDRLIHAERYSTSGTALLAPETYVAAARRALAPGERISDLGLPEGDGPVTVSALGARAPRRGPPARTTVYLDPPTARVLAVAPRSGGVMRFLHVLHGSLQVPGIGRTIVGWIGVADAAVEHDRAVAMVAERRSLDEGFRWRRHRNTDSNLHYQMGFWIALPLFVLSLTGVWISFPGVFGGREGGGRPAFAPPVAEPAQSVDTVVVRAAGVAKAATQRRLADRAVGGLDGQPGQRAPDQGGGRRRRGSGCGGAQAGRRGALDAADSRWRRYGDRLAGGDFPRRAAAGGTGGDRCDHVVARPWLAREGGGAGVGASPPSPRTWSGVHFAAGGMAGGSCRSLVAWWTPEQVRGDEVGGAAVVEYGACWTRPSSD